MGQHMEPAMQSDTKGGIPEATEQDEVDLEQYAKRGEKPPKAAKYRIRIDKVYYTVTKSAMTGKEILGVAGKTPESHFLDEKVHGGAPKRVKPDDVVDFTEKGIERFMTLPRTETEGAMHVAAARD
jgi:hypothetical protein